MIAELLVPAVRSALRRPGFSLVIVLIVAFSLGLATAAGNLAWQVFARPLPFAQPERLFVLSSTNPPEGWWEAPGSVAEFKHYQREAKQDDQVAVFFDQGSLNVSPETPGAPVERVPVSYVEHNFFPLLGVPPALGRLFVEEETREDAAPAVVVVSHRFWQTKLGGRVDVVGSTLRLNDRLYDVVGVMPAGFRDVSLESGNPEIWLPFPLAVGPLGPELHSNYTLRRCRALVRVNADVSRGAAQQEADAIAQVLNRERQADMEGRGFIVQPLRHYYFWRVQGAVAALAVGSLLVLVVAAVNLVNLLLVESLRRRQELAVRAALGADARRLAGALIAMSLMPVLVGGALAVTVALGLTAWLREAGVMVLPEFVRLELSVVGIAGGIAAALALAALAGLAPLRQARRLDLREALQAAGKGTGGAGGSRARNLLVAAEVTLATLLLTGTGLVAKSLWELINRPTGYRSEQLLTMTTQIDRTRHVTPAARAELIRQIDQAMRAAPSASAATVWNGGMLGLGWWVTALTPGHLDATDQKNGRTFQRNGTVPGGLAALGIRLLRGRDFSPDATPGQPVEIIIDERIAAALWPGEDPLGKTVFQNHNPARPGIIVGVAAPTRHRGRTFDESRNTGDAYFSAFQAPMDQVNLMFRIAPGAERATVEFARQQLARLEPTMAIFDVQLMEQRLAAEANVPRFTAMALGMFAAIALLLTTLGVYGVLAFAIAQRTREFGVRLAVGAQRGQVLAHVLAGGSRWIAAGVGAGLVLAAFCTPLMSSLLVGVRPHDPSVMAGASMIVAAIGLLGAAVPAWRASRVDPLTALRAE